jgi:hypothetical protein
MSNFDSKKFQIQLTRADQPHPISTYTDDYMEAISLVQCFNDGFAENGVDGKAELIIQDKLEQWKQTIRQQVHYVDVKAYSHNIISLALKEIDDLFGATVVNEVIEEFNLEELGWDKADCESDNNFDSKKINIQELKQAINGLADNWLYDEQRHYEECGSDNPNYKHGDDSDSDCDFDASEVPTAELNREHNYTHLRILLDFIHTLEGGEAPECKSRWKHMGFHQSKKESNVTTCNCKDVHDIRGRCFPPMIHKFDSNIKKDDLCYHKADDCEDNWSHCPQKPNTAAQLFKDSFVDCNDMELAKHVFELMQLNEKEVNEAIDQLLEWKKEDEELESEPDNEVDNEEAAWCEAGEHFVRPHNMWPDFADCVDCTTYKEYKEYIDEEG